MGFSGAASFLVEDCLAGHGSVILAIDMDSFMLRPVIGVMVIVCHLFPVSAPNLGLLVLEP